MTFRFVDADVLARLAEDNQRRAGNLSAVVTSIEQAMMQAGASDDWPRVRTDINATLQEMQASSRELAQRSVAAANLAHELNASAAPGVDTPILTRLETLAGWTSTLSTGITGAVLANELIRYAQFQSGKNLAPTFAQLLHGASPAAHHGAFGAPGAWLHAHSAGVGHLARGLAVAATVVTAGFDIHRNFTREEYAGNRSKQVAGAGFDVAVTVGGGIAGAKIGAAVGTFFGPGVGTIAGAVIGFGFGVGISWATQQFKQSPLRDHIVDGLAGDGWGAVKDDVRVFAKGAGMWFDRTAAPAITAVVESHPLVKLGQFGFNALAPSLPFAVMGR